MKISVVVPTYRRPDLLLRCIEALVKQTFPKHEFEIIVVTDGPDSATSEATVTATQSIQPLVKILSLTKKGGPAAARNLGWQNAKCELIAFTDDDCIPDVNWLSNFWTHYQSIGRSEAAFTGRTIVPISTPPTDYEKNIAHLEEAEFITANCAVTKQALIKVNGLDERFTMAWREDSDLQFKFIEKGIAIYKVENAVVTHPVRKAKWGVSLKEEKKGIYNALLFKKYPRLYKEKIQQNPPWHYYLILISIIITIVGVVKENDSMILGGILGWLIITTWFTMKRLASTSKSIRHITEMIFTSMLIPILSIYYRLFGAVKYKVPMFP
jgi:glycosyltransferase involved in cell wall biosynthesis